MSGKSQKKASINCPTCGASLKTEGNGRWYCPKCANPNGKNDRRNSTYEQRRRYYYYKQRQKKRQEKNRIQAETLLNSSKISTPVSLKKTRARKTVIIENVEQSEEATLNVMCPKCGHMGAIAFEILGGTREDPIKTMFRCVNCGERWRED